jgi:hypothetical protein
VKGIITCNDKQIDCPLPAFLQDLQSMLAVRIDVKPREERCVLLLKELKLKFRHKLVNVGTSASTRAISFHSIIAEQSLQ